MLNKKDHLDWLPKDQQTTEKIVFEKTSTLLNSNIIVSKQNSIDTVKYIKIQLKIHLKNCILMRIFVILGVKMISFIMRINLVG